VKHGYDEVFVGEDFDRQLAAATDGRGVDLVLDSVGGSTWERSLASLARYGRAVSFGNAGGAAPWSAGMADLAPKSLSVAGFSILGLSAADPALLRRLSAEAFALVATEGLELPVSAEFPLEEAAEAQRLLGGRASTGKLLLRVGAEA